MHIQAREHCHVTFCKHFDSISGKLTQFQVTSKLGHWAQGCIYNGCGCCPQSLINKSLGVCINTNCPQLPET